MEFFIFSGSVRLTWVAHNEVSQCKGGGKIKNSQESYYEAANAVDLVKLVFQNAQKKLHSPVTIAAIAGSSSMLDATTHAARQTPCLGEGSTGEYARVL